MTGFGYMGFRLGQQQLHRSFCVQLSVHSTVFMSSVYFFAMTTRVLDALATICTVVRRASPLHRGLLQVVVLRSAAPCNRLPMGLMSVD